MKRYWIILLLGFAIIGAVVWEQIYVVNTIDNLKSKTSALYDTIFNSDNVNTNQIINSVEELDDYWKERENFLCIIFNHKDIEKVGEQITKLTVLTLQNSKQEAEYEVELLKYYVEGYEHIMGVTFQNIW